MTPKQEERLKKKITDIKKALAADKRRWGGYYDDSSGLRYAPPEFYLKLRDYKGASRYFRWFAKNFPDDTGFSGFLFEWTVTLFKTGKRDDAQKKAMRTFFSNPYLLDYFFGRKKTLPFTTNNCESQQTVLEKYFLYKHDQEELQDFAIWLQEIMMGKEFLEITGKFLEIEQKLISEPAGDKRSQLVNRRSSLLPK